MPQLSHILDPSDSPVRNFGHLFPQCLSGAWWRTSCSPFRLAHWLRCLKQTSPLSYCFPFLLPLDLLCPCFWHCIVKSIRLNYIKRPRRLTDSHFFYLLVGWHKARWKALGWPNFLPTPKSIYGAAKRARHDNPSSCYNNNHSFLLPSVRTFFPIGKTHFETLFQCTEYAYKKGGNAS